MGGGRNFCDLIHPCGRLYGKQQYDAVTAENMDYYFNLLKSTYDEFNIHNFQGTIFIMDITGVPLNPQATHG